MFQPAGQSGLLNGLIWPWLIWLLLLLLLIWPWLIGLLIGCSAR
jgi:hypothetical protein